MRIKKSFDLSVLEEYRYHYEENLLYPTYKKVIIVGNGTIVIEIPILTREIYINRNRHITEKQKKYIQDLEKGELLEEK